MRIGIVLLALLSPAVMSAERLVRYDIPSLPLGDAISAWVDQSKLAPERIVSVHFSYITRVRLPPLQGLYTRSDALRELLRETCLEFWVEPSKVDGVPVWVIVRPPGDCALITHPGGRTQCVPVERPTEWPACLEDRHPSNRRS